jgi:hypothetical protein
MSQFAVCEENGRQIGRPKQIPKAIAQQFGIRPGDEIQWVSAGDAIRVILPKKPLASFDIPERLRLFDQATARQREREAKRPLPSAEDRGWTREQLYDRGCTG